MARTRREIEHKYVQEKVRADAARANAVEARRASLKRPRVDPVTTDRLYDADELEFLKAMDDYRSAHHRTFPTWSESLEVLRSLGYRKDPAHVHAPSASTL